MAALTEKILEIGFNNQVLTDGDLAQLLNTTQASRYGLVNKALKDKQLVRIRRGLYLLAPQYRQQKLSKFFLAARIVPHSYVSLESALAFHGWIPEYVPAVSSIIVHGRTRTFETPFGVFSYYSIPSRDYEFLTGVSREEEVNGKPYFLASPLRALTDYIYLRKIKWTNLEYLTHGLRIDIEQLNTLSSKDFLIIKKVYRTARVLYFLDCLQKELASG